MASPLGSEIISLPSPSGSVKTQKKTLNDVNNAAYEYFSQRKNLRATSTETPTDTDLSFLHSVLPDMKLMTSDQKRAFKIGILNLSEKILNGELPRSQQPSVSYLHPQRPQYTQAQYAGSTVERFQIPRTIKQPSGPLPPSYHESSAEPMFSQHYEEPSNHELQNPDTMTKVTGPI